MDTITDEMTKAALLRTLGSQRTHVLGIVEGLTDEQLLATRLPSGWCVAGMLDHLSFDVERYWFGSILGGAPIEERDTGGDPASWALEPGTSPHACVSRYRDEADAADRVLARVALEDPIAQRDQWWGDWQVPDVRFVLLHVIAETACHAGHLDATRELLDGRQWVVL
jgi:hypothetical protein